MYVCVGQKWPKCTYILHSLCALFFSLNINNLTRDVTKYILITSSNRNRIRLCPIPFRCVGVFCVCDEHTHPKNSNNPIHHYAVSVIFGVLLLHACILLFIPTACMFIIFQPDQ